MGGDTNEELLNTYDGYDDPTGVPTPRGRNVRETSTVTLTQAEYDAMSAAGEIQQEKTYVIVG